MAVVSAASAPLEPQAMRELQPAAREGSPVPPMAGAPMSKALKAGAAGPHGPAAAADRVVPNLAHEA